MIKGLEMEMRVVCQGDWLNHPSNQVRWEFNSLISFPRLSPNLAMESRTTPVLSV